jgi:dimethylsulfone monooxygenase
MSTSAGKTTRNKRLAAEMGQQVDEFRQPVLNDENELKLVMFGINLRGGVTMSDVPGRIQADWDENRRLAVRADDLGLDAIVPVARWRSSRE